MKAANDDVANRELRITKTLPVPVESVWEVWTNSQHIANWWGPNGFTNTIQEMNVVDNGEWRFTMHGPDGKNYPNRSVFIDIVPLKRIVFQHFNPDFRTTVVFDSKGKETFMEWRMLFETTELFDTVVKVFKADEGLKQNVEKLENYLKQNVK